jgi:hypothetical protein
VSHAVVSHTPGVVLAMGKPWPACDLRARSLGTARRAARAAAPPPPRARRGALAARRRRRARALRPYVAALNALISPFARATMGYPVEHRLGGAGRADSTCQSPGYRSGTDVQVQARPRMQHALGFHLGRRERRG